MYVKVLCVWGPSVALRDCSFVVCTPAGPEYTCCCEQEIYTKQSKKWGATIINLKIEWQEIKKQFSNNTYGSVGRKYF